MSAWMHTASAAYRRRKRCGRRRDHRSRSRRRRARRRAPASGMPGLHSATIRPPPDGTRAVRTSRAMAEAPMPPWVHRAPAEGKSAGSVSSGDRCAILIDRQNRIVGRVRAVTVAGMTGRRPVRPPSRVLQLREALALPVEAAAFAACLPLVGAARCGATSIRCCSCPASRRVTCRRCPCARSCASTATGCTRGGWDATSARRDAPSRACASASPSCTTPTAGA